MSADTEKRFNLVDLLETLAITDGDECKYYQNCNDDFMSLCKELNTLYDENIRLKKDFDSCSHNWALLYDEAKEKVEALTKENWELERENEKLENRLWNCQNVR